jgi:hypothetical protein
LSICFPSGPNTLTSLYLSSTGSLRKTSTLAGGFSKLSEGAGLLSSIKAWPNTFCADESRITEAIIGSSIRKDKVKTADEDQSLWP